MSNVIGRSHGLSLRPSANVLRLDHERAKRDEDVLARQDLCVVVAVLGCLNAPDSKVTPIDARKQMLRVLARHATTEELLSALPSDFLSDLASVSRRRVAP